MNLFFPLAMVFVFFRRSCIIVNNNTKKTEVHSEYFCSLWGVGGAEEVAR